MLLERGDQAWRAARGWTGRRQLSPQGLNGDFVHATPRRVGRHHLFHFTSQNQCGSLIRHRLLYLSERQEPVLTVRLWAEQPRTRAQSDAEQRPRQCEPTIRERLRQESRARAIRRYERRLGSQREQSGLDMLSALAPGSDDIPG
jgi:hypothetical protein